MLQLSEQQLQKRYYSLPQKLKDVLDSPNIGDVVKNICINNHLSPEKAESVAMIVGQTLLGFLHAEDLAKEISDDLGLDKRIADSIVDDINNKILAPIKDDLQKNYAPAEEIYTPSPEVAEIIRKSKQLMMEIERGLQTQSAPQEEIIDLRTMTKKSDLSPEIKKSAEIEKPIETEKLIETKSTEIKKSVEIEKSEMEGPMIIHKEVDFAPTLGAKRSLGGLFNFLNKKEGEAGPVVATIDLGPSITEMPKLEAPKVVHYGELKTLIPMPEKKSMPKASLEIPVPEPKPGLKIEQKIEQKIEFPKVEIPKEIKKEETKKEEIKKESFFSRIGKSISGLFTTKQKIFKEMSPLPPKPAVEPIPETSKPKESILMKKFDVKAPIEMFRVKQPAPEVKAPEIKVSEIKVPEPEIKIAVPENKGVRELLIVEAKKDFRREEPIPQPKPSTPSPTSNNEEIIDLRTFQKVTK